MDCIDRLKEIRLPPKSAFYSKLNDADISDVDYEHAQTVWKEFGRKTLVYEETHECTEKNRSILERQETHWELIQYTWARK